MPAFSMTSVERLSTCHPLLQQLFYAVILEYDCTIIQGYRSHEEQIVLYNQGKTKVRTSKHNEMPSRAVDVAPYLPGRGIPWPIPKSPSYIKDLNQFYHFAGYVEALAKELHLNLRWGGDWDRDHNITDQSFNDLVHFEIGGI
jgi:peptidoglycan L-alanyl-D-glutamate endopeptidase CwlK